jgi:hypothetical protein
VRRNGQRNREIADRLFISEKTVKIHIKHVMEKHGANHRAQAVAIARPLRNYPGVAEVPAVYILYICAICAQSPSPLGRGLGEGPSICNNLDRHLTRFYLCFAQRERAFPLHDSYLRTAIRLTVTH